MLRVEKYHNPGEMLCEVIYAYAFVFIEHTCHPLQILETALMCQNGFLDASRAAATSSLVLTGLDKLILGVNPRSGRADHALNVAKFVG